MSKILELLETRDAIDSLINDLTMANKIHSPQTSIVLSKREKIMLELQSICKHSWVSKYDYEDLRYEECSVCLCVKKM